MKRVLPFLIVVAPFATAIAAPPKGPGKKPPVATSASASESASAPASANGSSSVVTLPAPTSSVPVSPLTPRPDEAPPVKGSASAKPQQSYDDLMAEIASLRARVATVGNAVWKSKIAVTFRARGSHAKIAWAKLSLDGAQVWAAPKAFAAEDDTAIFEGGVAAGPHALTIEIERRDDRDESFRTIDKTTTTVMVPQGKRLEVEIRLEDDSSMGGDFPGDGAGTYEMKLKLKAKAK
ncbi:MAG: hypothetical protein ACXVEF_05670 [Polyangiales bacterium]